MSSSIGRAIRLVAIFCVAAGTQAAESPKDPVLEKGKAIAQEVCSACHMVAVDQRYPPLLSQPAPSFVDIANRAGMTDATIQRFTASTHWDQKTIPLTMPDLMLIDSQRVAVARYIMSLRRR